MKRSTARWTTAIGVAALIALPASTWGQTPPTSPPTEQSQSAQPPNPQEAQPPAESPPSPKIDQEATKRHLTAARDTLSQLTQLPEAAQLSGEARAQVSQLITNFNELITTQTEWRAAYIKVDANLSTLIGAERTDEANVPPPAPATAGAIGTSGMQTLDPKIRERLVEFRHHLTEFQRAAGGASAAATPAPDEPATASAAPPAGATGAPPAGTTGTMAGPPAATVTGTTGTTTAPTPTPEQNRPTAEQNTEAMGHGEAMRHIDAMEAILNRAGQAMPDTTGTTGTTPTATQPTATSPAPTTPAGGAGDVRFDKAQVDQLRMHLSELRRLIKEAEKKQ